MDSLTEWSTDANEALSITLLSPVGDSANPPKELATFNPKFTYQIFGENEAIFGYKDLKARIYFAADDMTPCVHVAWSKKIAPVKDIVAEDVVEVLKEYLPSDAFKSLPGAFKSSLQSRKTFTPPGTPIHTYNNSTKTYTLYHSTLSNPDSRALLENLQILLLFYIEGASYIPLDDDEWTNSRWDLFFLYETDEETSQQVFVGYTTVYRYYYFDLKSASDLSRARISQFLILPNFQSQGHGGKLYDAIIKHYLDNPQTLQVAVEDPSESFSDLRDIHDLRRLRKIPEFSKLTTIPPIPAKQDLDAFRRSAKLPLRQFERLLELEMLTKLDKEDRKMFRAYRLFVKGRLYKQNQDSLSQLDRLERVDKLEETYIHVEDDHLRILKAMEGGRVRDEYEESDDEEEADGEEEEDEGAEEEAVDEEEIIETEAPTNQAKGKNRDAPTAVEVRPKKRLRIEF
ncbi:histone acetyltransferase 1 [Rhizina undulata]